MEYQDNLKIVENLLNREAVISQLVEEAVELAKAIIYYIDAGGCSNYAGRGLTEYRNMEEEVADIDLVMDVVFDLIYDTEEKRICNGITESMKVVAESMTERNLMKSIQKVCLDIAKLSLKLNRASGNGNPTPLKEQVVKKDLLCHIAMIKAFIDQRFHLLRHNCRIDQIKKRKAECWAQRLTGGVENEGVYEDRPEFLGK